MAKEVLGTFIKKRKRLAKPHGLHSLQSCKTWLCSKSGRVALWVIPSCCKAGIVSGRLGSKRTSIHQWNGFGIRVGWIKRSESTFLLKYYLTAMSKIISKKWRWGELKIGERYSPCPLPGWFTH